MAEIHETYRLPNNVVSTLETKSVNTLLKELGMTDNGTLQTFHTANVLRRIKKYMAFRTGMTIKVTIAQTDINKPRIITDVPYGEVLFFGKKKKGKPIRYTTTKNKQAGPRPDKAVEAAEGAAMAKDLEREIKRRGIP
ncbi:hypothetical protein LJC64_02295 [Ruminococcaceae bacterium OttesenSCG-928-A11]|nr:hypothetical protein [Ruminococcaceae bacterium OttesenSCG-928-A11]